MKVIFYLLPVMILSSLLSYGQDLTDEQDDAVRGLKSSVQEGLPAILAVRAKKQPEEGQMKTLVAETEKYLKDCATQKVPDTYEFEVVDYSNDKWPRIKFSVKSLKTELASWKSASNAQVAASSKQAAETQNAEQQKQFQYKANSFIERYNNNAQLFTDEHLKGLEAGDEAALDKMTFNGNFLFPTLMDLRSEFQKCLDANISDNFVFQFDGGKKYTMAQLKVLVPKWATTGEKAVLKADPELAEQQLPVEVRTAITLFKNAYSELGTSLENLKNGNTNTNNEWAYYEKEISEANAALAKVKRVNAPLTTNIGYQKPITIAEAEKQLPTLATKMKAAFAIKDDDVARFKAYQSPERIKSYEKLRAQFASVLTGDKMAKMELMIVHEGVFGANPYLGGKFYDVGKKEIKTPEEFAKAKIWATTWTSYADNDYLKNDPHWRIDAWHFDGMKLVNETSWRGDGTTAPNSEFVYRP